VFKERPKSLLLSLLIFVVRNLQIVGPEPSTESQQIEAFRGGLTFWKFDKNATNWYCWSFVLGWLSPPDCAVLKL